MQHSYTRGKTNLGGEGETEVEQGAEVVLVDSIIPYVIACYLELVKSQDNQKETSVEYAIRKVTTRKIVPCLDNSNLITPERQIKVLLR